MSGSLTKPGARRAELEQASVDRPLDDQAFFAASRCASAMATWLYSLEIRLKVKICFRMDLDALPTAFETHDFQGLLILTGPSKRLEAPHFRHEKAKWDFVSSYKSHHINELRYSPTSHWY
jgi:hypothetical protein